MAILRSLDDPSKLFIIEEEFTIRLNSENSLMLPDDSEISRQHARFVRTWRFGTATSSTLDEAASLSRREAKH
jgi:hypothetical protein